MLVRKQQEWDVQQPEQEVTTTAAVVTVPVLDTRLRAKCLTVIGLMVLIAAVVTIGSEVIVRRGYDLVAAKAEFIRTEKENELLRLEIAKLKSPERIQEIAIAELGMVAVTDVYYAANTVAQASVQSDEPPTGNQLLGSLMDRLQQRSAADNSGR